MSDSDRGFGLIHGVVGVTYNGKTLPLTPRQVFAVSEMISQGKVDAKAVGSNNVAAVTISNLRAVLRDLGVPYTIKNSSGTSAFNKAMDGWRSTYELMQLPD